MAVEKVLDDLGIQDILMRLVAREFMETLARMENHPLQLSALGVLEAATGIREWPRSHAIYGKEDHRVEMAGDALYVTIDGLCTPAVRCREIVLRGLHLGCQRSVEYEVAPSQVTGRVLAGALGG
jgi:hypothetical protein